MGYKNHCVGFIYSQEESIKCLCNDNLSSPGNSKNVDAVKMVNKSSKLQQLT